MPIDVVPLTPNIGAEIRGVDLRDELDAETVAAIRDAWLDQSRKCARSDGSTLISRAGA